MTMLKKPVIDCWKELKLRLRVYPVPFTYVNVDVAGYAYTCIPSAWSTPITNGVEVTIPSNAGLTSADFYGKNRYLNLAWELYQATGDSGALTVQFFRSGPVRVFYPFQMPTVKVQVTSGGVGRRDGEWSLYGGYGGGTSVSRPPGTWEPCCYTWSIEPASVDVSTRTTSSPYQQRFSTRLVWGAQHTASLLVDIVPAADIYGYRVNDMPHDGWAAKASRQPGLDTTSTLEAVWSDLYRATPQRVLHRKFSTDGGWGYDATNHDTRWTPDHGRPAILYLDSDAMLKGFALGGDMRDAWGAYDLPAQDRRFRHIMLDDEVSMQSVLEARVSPNRAYTVTIPFIDVTPGGAGEYYYILPRGQNA